MTENKVSPLKYTYLLNILKEKYIFAKTIGKRHDSNVKMSYSINAPTPNKALPPEKILKNNNRTGTFIWKSGVLTLL